MAYDNYLACPARPILLPCSLHREIDDVVVVPPPAPTTSSSSWGSIHSVSVPCALTHLRLPSRGLQTACAGLQTCSRAVSDMVRCGGEKPSHMLETSASFASAAACDGLHGGATTQRDYKLTKAPQPRLESQFSRRRAREASVISLFPSPDFLELGGGRFQRTRCNSSTS